MITRFVFMKLKDAYQNEAGLNGLVAETNRVFPLVKSIKDFSISFPADQASMKAWDFCLTVRFETEENLEDYRGDRIHRAYVDQFLEGRVEVKKAWNFQATQLIRP